MAASDTHAAAEPVPGAAPATTGSARAWLVEMLRAPRYEVLPLPGVPGRVADHVPTTLPVTVTATERRGLEATLATSERLAAHGYHAVPHLPARLVRDERHLVEVLHRTEQAGLTELFVIAGDSAPLGDFADSLSLLTAIDRLRQQGIGGHLLSIGMAGYPQGHPAVPAEELADALRAKVPFTSYVVTQMCFDHRSIARWLAATRAGGLELPVHVGVPGAVDATRLLRIAARIGVQQSAGFLLRHRGQGLGRLLLPGRHRPDRLLGGLARDGLDQELQVAGLHVYTLGSVRDTERWRLRTIEQLGHGAES